MVGPTKLKGDLVDAGFDLDAGYLQLPEGPGLGVDLSMSAVRKYALAPQQPAAELVGA